MRIRGICSVRSETFFFLGGGGRMVWVRRRGVQLTLLLLFPFVWCTGTCTRDRSGNLDMYNNGRGLALAGRDVYDGLRYS